MSHARREGREKNNACPHTIVRAVPAPIFERGYPIDYLVSHDYVPRHTGRGSGIRSVDF